MKKKWIALLLAAVMVLSLTGAFAAEGDDDVMTIQITSLDVAAPFTATADGTGLTDVAVREAAYVPYAWDGTDMSPAAPVDVYVVTVPEGAASVTLTFPEGRLVYNYLNGATYLAGEYADIYSGASTAEITVDVNEDGIADYAQVQTPYDENWNSTTLYAVTFAAPGLKAAVPFSDLAADWYDAGVRYAYGEQLMRGVGGDKFNPLGTVTCGEVATVLYRLAESPAVETADSAWYAPAMTWAAENEIASADADATSKITREELAKMIYQYVQSKGEGFQGMWMFLLDVADREEIDDSAYEAACWLSMHGVMTGKPGNLFAPKDTLTRAELATVLQRLADAA